MSKYNYGWRAVVFVWALIFIVTGWMWFLYFTASWLISIIGVVPFWISVAVLATSGFAYACGQKIGQSWEGRP